MHAISSGLSLGAITLLIVSIIQMMRTARIALDEKGTALLFEGLRKDTLVGRSWKVLLIIRQFITILVLILLRDFY